MDKLYVVIWFRYLKTDWFSIKDPSTRNKPLVLMAPQQGKMIITAVNPVAQQAGIDTGTSLADARAIVPGLEAKPDQPDKARKWLEGLGHYCNRFCPSVSLSGNDTLCLDVSGCSHLWGGDRNYLHSIRSAFQQIGYQVRLSMAATPGAAWAMTRFGADDSILPPGKQMDALLLLPPAALQLETSLTQKLEKLGLKTIAHLLQLPKASLNRRFGPAIANQLAACAGSRWEPWEPLFEPPLFQERLASLDPIITLAGVETALHELLSRLLPSLAKAGSGVRQAVFTGFKTGRQSVSVQVGTCHPVQDHQRLFRLFEMKWDQFRIDPGIESFLLEATWVEPVQSKQESCWNDREQVNQEALSDLADRLSNKLGASTLRQFSPAAHHWPENAYTSSPWKMSGQPMSWQRDVQRPILLLPQPQPVEVAAPVPDYPPLHFRYRGKLHKIIRADGPERIEPEWWLRDGLHRDYYIVEDEAGQRYWLFRSGHYQAAARAEWFLHGYFA